MESSSDEEEVFLNFFDLEENLKGRKYVSGSKIFSKTEKQKCITTL